MIEIIKSNLFKNYPEIIFGFSTKIGLNRESPFYFNMSKSVGDEINIVEENREAFFNQLNLKTENIAFQKQIHSGIVNVAQKSGICGEGDALITNQRNIGLAISSADCALIFIYDFKEKVISGVHSGWRGTQQTILNKTLVKLQAQFNSKPQNLAVYIAPSISQKNYEVGSEFHHYFDKKYLLPKNDKYLLDVKSANYDMLINFGIPEQQIEVSDLCSYEEEYLHSYRREGIKSGRALGIIALR